VPTIDQRAQRQWWARRRRPLARRPGFPTPRLALSVVIRGRAERASPESILPRNMRPDGFRVRATRAPEWRREWSAATRGYALQTINPAVIVREGGRSSIPEAIVIYRAAAAYWIARSSRAMTAW